MKKIVLLFFVLPLSLLAAPVGQKNAKNAAINGFRELAGIKSPRVYLYHTIKNKSGTPLLYIYNLTDSEGFVLISADDRVKPVLGYSTENDFDTSFIPDGMQYFLDLYKSQINDLILNNLEGEPQAKNLWKKYSSDPKNFRPVKNNRFYLLGNIEWDQGCGWNSYCPYDSDGPCNHVWAGCVATAAGMIMKYWEYPDHGIGSKTYTDDTYGEQSADFENTNYNWDAMQDGSATDAAALLLYHIGVAVSMDYGTNGSGAFFGDELNAFKYYFGYSNDIQFQQKSWYSDEDWINILKNELDNGRPIPYKGESQSSGGHAFVCDGYDSNNYFHFNWGWSGWYNGYYSINNLNPGGENFSENQSIGINVQPQTPAPQNFQIDTQIVNNQVNAILTWEEPDALTQVYGYVVYRDDQILTETNQTQFTDYNVPEGVHIYKVKAKYNFYLYGEMLSDHAYLAIYIEVPANIKNKEFKITPNPVSNYINLNLPYQNYKVQISDLSGKIMIEKNNSPQIINISGLAEGVYILKIISNQKILIKKFVKQ